MRISASLPQGVAALLFGAARRRRELEARLVERLSAAGFDEVVLPIVDYLEPYEPLLAAAGRGELYRFVDRDGELLALRADFTPMLARLLAPMLGGGNGGGPPALALPLRLFYRGDVVRYGEERPGRDRELYQVGAELLGVPGADGEREMLRLFLALLA
ncbi:MAG TPA: ATP phosphoribosyltransferase regulatory subunit, partial [Thermoanaerobaculia bacterium]|nr:ATP phosphoribosyltransferase regulatory subunit [Thermoanaerobaculia bacterium]